VAALTSRFAALRTELGIPADFPPEVLDAAGEAARAPQPPREDLTAVPFVTVDPPGSTDLDQALHLAGASDGVAGFRVHYAIADVPAFVPPLGPVDTEARRRGQTLYAPDTRTPLHPPELSEGAASLLPDQDRPAFVWRFDLDAAGEVRSFDVVRATVRSRARLDYERVQRAVDTPDPDPHVTDQALLLARIGALRIALERARGGANLPLPEQDVVADGGRFTLTLRAGLPSEDWNAQLSLMTGMAAARLMLDAGVGILRTLPAPDEAVLRRFRRQAVALGVVRPPDMPLAELLASLDRDDPAELALLHEAGSLFRGAGYSPLLPGSPPAVTTHAAVAAPYAHVTAPLRRLVDRFGLVVAHAVCHGEPVPAWVVEALPSLPAVMSASDQLAGRLDRGCRDAVEAAVLHGRVGEVFDAVVVDAHEPRNGSPAPDGGKVQLREPAVVARCSGPVRPGTAVRVRLTEADVATGTVLFALHDTPDGAPGTAAEG